MFVRPTLSLRGLNSVIASEAKQSWVRDRRVDTSCFLAMFGRVASSDRFVTTVSSKQACSDTSLLAMTREGGSQWWVGF